MIFTQKAVTGQRVLRRAQESARECQKAAESAVVNDRTGINLVRPNPNGSVISTEGSAEQFGRTSTKITSKHGPKLSKIDGKNCKKIGTF